jgi:hypothetical protein
MRSVLFTFAVFLFIQYSGNAQDEGPITKKARVLSKATTVYFVIGPSFPMGGDYNGGLNLQAGLLKRLNRIVSVGPFVSFTKFNSDAAAKDIFIEEGGYEIKIVRMQGGDLKFFSVGMDVKFNFIPAERIKKFSMYAIVKPFLLISSRSAVSGNAETWYRDDIGDDKGTTWYYGGTTEQLSPDRWNAETEFSGGMHAGVGGEWIMASGLSLLLQSTAGFTLPVSHIDTSSFKQTLADGYNNADYPFAKQSFSSIALSLGVAYTF